MKRLLAVALAFLLLPANAANAAEAQPAQRIVSLMPSLTETLFAIGAGERVVAVSAYTTYPAPAARLPVVASFASVDAERIVRLRPDLVVGISSQAAQTRDLVRAGLHVVLLKDDSLADLYAGVTTLGQLTGRAEQAQALDASLRRRTRELAAGAVRAERPSVFVVLQVAPIYTVGNRSFIAELIALAGGRNAAAALPDAYGRFSEEALVAAQPGVLIGDRLSGLTAALGRPPWNALHAVALRHVFIAPNADVLERPGPRYNEGLAWLVERLRSVES